MAKCKVFNRSAVKGLSNTYMMKYTLFYPKSSAGLTIAPVVMPAVFGPMQLADVARPLS